MEKIINILKKKDPELFYYQKAEHIHLHDRFIEKLFLWFLPYPVTPNRVTMFRILMTPVILLLVGFAHYKMGVLIFLGVAFTDAIDGAMARTRNQVTKFGMLFDPLADKLLIGSMVLLLVFRYFDFWIGFSILFLEIAFILSALVAKAKFRTVRMANLWGKLKMILQVLAVFLTLMALLLDFPLLLHIAGWIFGFALGFAILSLFAQGV